MKTQEIDPSVWRLLDSSFNRASEAIRVVEDCLRFTFNDTRLTELAKRFRHQLHEHLQNALSGNVDLQQRLLHMRDSSRDVGRTISIPQARGRDNIVDMLSANNKRFQQALRTLEETAKLFDEMLASAFEHLRYEAYALEKQISSLIYSQNSLSTAWLCVLVDGGESAELFERRMRKLIGAGIPLIQLREKHLSCRDLVDRGLILRRLTADTGTRWILNDRVDLAVVTNADGVHLGQDDLPAHLARKILGPNRWIGVSTHSIDQVNQAIESGADYLGVGPVFPSTTKSFESCAGLDLLKAVIKHTALPAFAIGGIDAANALEVFATGIKRIAVSAAFSPDRDPVVVAGRLLEAKQRAEQNSEASMTDQTVNVSPSDSSP